VGDVPYTLGLAHDDVVPAAIRLRHGGARLLGLHNAREEQPLALFVLRPRLAAGVADLIQACRRHSVEMGLLLGTSLMGDAMAAQEVARRAQVPLLSETDPLEAIRARQNQGAVVAFVSDSAHAAPMFAACDLAIGWSSGRSGQFPARADLLAPDLGALIAILEAGARRDAATRDAVALSAVANVAGAVWGFRGQPGIERASLAVHITALAALADGWARSSSTRAPSAGADGACRMCCVSSTPRRRA
jgi:cation-transporting ATPase I